MQLQKNAENTSDFESLLNETTEDAKIIRAYAFNAADKDKYCTIRNGRVSIDGKLIRKARVDPRIKIKNGLIISVQQIENGIVVIKDGAETVKVKNTFISYDNKEQYFNSMENMSIHMNSFDNVTLYEYLPDHMQINFQDATDSKIKKQKVRQQLIKFPFGEIKDKGIYEKSQEIFDGGGAPIHVESWGDF